MADAMCGPSNALQQFKQQTNVDRTLQQDRLTSRHHPAQGFRSQNPNAAQLDADFEAFQAGFDAPVLDHHAAQSFQSPRGFAPQNQAPAWAADFQNLQISTPPAYQQQHFQPGPSTSNWAQGFQQHVAQSAPRAQTSAQSPLAFQQRARYGLTGFQSSFAQQNYAPVVQQSKGKERVMADLFDEAAFDRAFDMAKEDMMLDAEENAQAEAEDQRAEEVEAIVEQEATSMLREIEETEKLHDYLANHSLHQPDIEHESMEQMVEQREQVQQAEQQQAPYNDDDQLAATAQELLEKVEHNQSDKFKNSQFLGLMRRLRDREVRVEGDKMVETANASSATTLADESLNVASTNTDTRRPIYNSGSQSFHIQAPVDTRPPDYGIPEHLQDHDAGRINPNDGQEVVDLLNQQGPLTDDMAYDPTFAEGSYTASINNMRTSS
ncbi:unnamed protein product [Zymoseptoria tritici ST99CH_1A5]|uniref:Peroxin 20 n=1 Tax=Zymoseptoria tritici ST99CH_1A5 TaxID=1276529 RepID=A0A1Y6L5L2_ZYMTR|nr:unnamed protein product [Zymoseptoria tritici ST99CH_1A5]